MLINLIKNLPIFIKNSLRIGISILAIGFVSYQIYQQPIDLISLKPLTNFDIFISVFFLSLFNWLFEIYKWQTVVGSLEKISFKRAYWETMNAYALGTITPFNSGNYLRKTLFYPHQPSLKIFQLNFIKGIYQMIATLLFGFFAIIPISTFVKKLNTDVIVMTGIFLGILIFIMTYILKKKITAFIQLLNYKTHLTLLITSILRFCCFSILLTLLLYQYQPAINFFKLYSSICAIYLLSSLLPVFNLADLATKGSVAILILNPLHFSSPQILMSYFIVWLTNNAIPTIIGGFMQLNKTKL